MSTPLIAFTDLTRTFGTGDAETHALRGVTETVQEGEFVAIMGASGSGKSTLMHILGLLDHQTSGSYELEGRDTKLLTGDERAHLRNEKIGFVFQSFHLLARTSVLNNVLLPLDYSRVPKAEQRSRAQDALAKVELSHRTEHLPNQLSGGEKQRTAIARALVNNPKILFADEPTGNLDSKTGSTVMNVLAELHKAGHTIIIVTHEEETAQYAKRRIRLRDGEIMKAGTPSIGKRKEAA